MARRGVRAAMAFALLLRAIAPAHAAGAAPQAPSPLLACLEPIARAFHVRIVDRSGFESSMACAPLQPRQNLQQAMAALLQPAGLTWRQLDDGTLEIVAATAPSSVKLPALDIEGDPLPELERPDNPLATPLVEHASATTSLDHVWLDSAPLLGFNQIGWYAPNVYSAGQTLAIRGTERDSDYFPALTVTFDGIELGTRLLDDELVPLEDVTGLKLARGPHAFESGEGSQAGVIALKTAASAAEPTTSAALGTGNFGARDAAVSWSGPLAESGLAATVALDRHELPGFVRQRAVPQANVEKRRNGFGRIKLRYVPDALAGLSAELAALALSGDSSERQVVAPEPIPGRPLPPFDPLARDSYATDPLVARTHARGAAGFVRYDRPDQWAIDAHASVTTIFRDVSELPGNTQWTDQELRRRAGLTLSDHPAPDWTVLGALERDHMATIFYTPIASRQAVFNQFSTSTDSASLWVEHAWSSAWNTGLGVRWLYERTSVLAATDHGYAYRVPIPLAVVEWHPWAQHTFALSYGTGYRSGGQVNSGTFSYNPERSRNLELAWRAQWFDDTMHTALSAFYGENSNRFTYYASNPAGAPILGSVRDRGVEFELDAKLAERWQLRAGVGALSSRFVSFRSGDATSEAPPQTATLGLRYGTARGWYGAADAYYAAAALYYNPAGRLPPYDVLSLRIGYRTAHWDAALIATNALDATFAERVQSSAANQSGYLLGDPRRVELRVKSTW